MDENVQKCGNIEYIPTMDFFHRQNKSFFWLLEKIIPFANNLLFRYLLGKVGEIMSCEKFKKKFKVCQRTPIVTSGPTLLFYQIEP